MQIQGEWSIQRNSCECGENWEKPVQSSTTLDKRKKTFQIDAYLPVGIIVSYFSNSSQNPELQETMSTVLSEMYPKPLLQC